MVDPSNFTLINDNAEQSSNKRLIIQTDLLAHHLLGRLSNALLVSSDENISSNNSIHLAGASTLLSNLTNGNIQQQKQILSHLLTDYFESRNYADAATQVTDNNTSRILALSFSSFSF